MDFQVSITYSFLEKNLSRKRFRPKVVHLSRTAGFAVITYEDSRNHTASIRPLDQWGNGLKIIAHELKSYPEIEFRWFEKGLQFQVQFIKKNYKTKPQEEYFDSIGTKSAPSRHQVGTKSAPSRYQALKLIQHGIEPINIQDLMEIWELKDRSKFRAKHVRPLLELGILSMTIPDKPNSSKQQYYLTEKGKEFLATLHGLPLLPQNPGT